MKRFCLIMLLTCIVNTAYPQKPPAVLGADDRDPSGIIRDTISARGVEGWSKNEVLMGLTRPPMQPVQFIPEWEKPRAILFAVDSEIVGSFALNRRMRTTNNPVDVFDRSQKVTEILNELICEPAIDEANEDHDDTKTEAKPETDSGCEDGQLDPVTLERLFDRLAIAHDFLTTMSQMSQFVDVVLLVNSSRPYGDLTVEKLIDDMKLFNAAVQPLGSRRVFFIQAPFDTKWIRDYGPLFVRDTEGAIISVDTRYDPESTDQHDQLKELANLTRQLLRGATADGTRPAHDEKKGAEKDADTRLHDDQFPTMFATRLRQRDGALLRRYPISVVRPPIVLPGGDFLTDGVGTGFTSTRTLRENGGNVEILDLNLKKYMGIDNVVYLHPLPGETVKHIDMFLQIAAPNVLLLGKFLRPANEPSAARLQSAASAALEDNLEIIRNHYQRMNKTVRVIDDDGVRIDPHAINIVRVPLPPVARPFASALEQAVREFNAAQRDYDEHSTLLRLISRFHKQIEKLKLENEALTELKSEASESHPADSYDLELFDALNESEADLGKIMARYAILSGEYTQESDAIKNGANQLGAAIERLTASAKGSIAKRQPISLTDLGAVKQDTTELLRLSQDFTDRVQGDTNKEDSLVTSAIGRMEKSQTRVQQILTQYEYGTDLYRTHLNLLPIRTSNSFVLAIPSYRDPDTKGDEVSATKRIESVYRQLYGDVKLIFVPSDAFIKEMGSVHCLTKALPEYVDFLVSGRNRPDGN